MRSWFYLIVCGIGSIAMTFQVYGNHDHQPDAAYVVVTLIFAICYVFDPVEQNYK